MNPGVDLGSPAVDSRHPEAPARRPTCLVKLGTSCSHRHLIAALLVVFAERSTVLGRLCSDLALSSVARQPALVFSSPVFLLAACRLPCASPPCILSPDDNTAIFIRPRPRRTERPVRTAKLPAFSTLIYMVHRVSAPSNAALRKIASGVESYRGVADSRTNSLAELNTQEPQENQKPARWFYLSRCLPLPRLRLCEHQARYPSLSRRTSGRGCSLCPCRPPC